MKCIKGPFLAGETRPVHGEYISKTKKIFFIVIPAGGEGAGFAREPESAGSLNVHLFLSVLGFRFTTSQILPKESQWGLSRLARRTGSKRMPMLETGLEK